MKRRDLHPPGRHAKRVLAVRVMVAKCAWLEGAPYWENGRVVWRTTRGAFAPARTDLARTQFTLQKLAAYPVSSEIALGDADGWRAERWARLELAKRLCELRVSDWAQLAQAARADDPNAIKRLIALCAAEAHCLSPLPLSPAALLVTGRSALVAPLLQAQGANVALDLPTRTLSALVLGAIERRDAPPFAKSEPAVLRRAYRWGAREGVPADPGFVARLLAEEEGEELAQRCLAAWRTPLLGGWNRALFSQLFAEGVSARRLVEIVEAFAESAPIRERLRSCRQEPPAENVAERRQTSERNRALRQQALDEYIALYGGYALTLRDPQALHHLAAFTEKALAFNPKLEALRFTVFRPLQEGRTLAPPLQGAFLELLNTEFYRLWKRGQGRRSRCKDLTPAWFEERWRHGARAAHCLLKRSKDPALVREAIERNVHSFLAAYELPSAPFYWYWLELAQALGVAERCDYATLGSNLSRFPTIGAARNALQLLAQALRPIEDNTLRFHLFERLAEETWDWKSEQLRLPALRPYLPQLIAALQTLPSEACLCRMAAQSAIQLLTHAPERVPGRLQSFLTLLRERLAHGALSLTAQDTIPEGVALACWAAQEDENAFLALLRVVLFQPSERFSGNAHSDALRWLMRYPILRGSLCRLLPQQPKRLAEALAHIGLLSTRERKIVAPLERLCSPALEGDLPEAWREVLASAPESAAQIALYRQAQRLLGQPDALPPGVRKALEKPLRLAQEKAYLTEALAQNPERAELAARIAALERRSDTEIQRRAEAEAAERLAWATADAWIAALEKQIEACYRERLESLTGALPETTILDANLRNAIILGLHIRENRSLLLKLLRAYLEGDRAWRDRHPANVAFLETFATQGVEVAVWQARNERAFACQGAAGGIVRLALENDPLEIFQMGNYFGTCLSVADCNAFSVVANACEWNKRVIFARDGAGRVVGRKLLALNEAGKLVGFHTYTAMQDRAGGAALERIVQEYVAEWAHRCGLEMAQEGAIPRLFASDWYDDGIVDWEDLQRFSSSETRYTKLRQTPRREEPVAWRTTSSP